MVVLPPWNWFHNKEGNLVGNLDANEQASVVRQPSL